MHRVRRVFALLTAILACNHLDESLLSDGTGAAFGGCSAVPACAASVTPETIALVNSAPPQVLFAAPGTGPTAANSLLAAYMPLTFDSFQYQQRQQSDMSLDVRLADPTDGSVRWIAGACAADIDREVVVLGRLRRPGLLDLRSGRHRSVGDGRAVHRGPVRPGRARGEQQGAGAGAGAAVRRRRAAEPGAPGGGRRRSQP